MPTFNSNNTTLGLANYNPYYDYVKQIFTDGLDYIISNPPEGGDWTLRDLNNVTVSYVRNTFDMSPDSPPPLGDILGNIIVSIIPNAVNDFTNNKTLNAFSRQKFTLYSILNGLKTNSIDSYDSYFNLATGIIVNSSANNADKAVLYIALAIAEVNYNYWKEKIANPGDWSTYLNSNEAINYANLPYWINVSFKGSLSGFAQVQMPAVGAANILNDMGRSAGVIGAITAALGLTAGKVIFKWAQKPPYYHIQKALR